MSKTVEVLTVENYKEKLSKGSVMLYVGADWCGPCQMMKPVLGELVELGETIYKADTDETPEIAAEYKVRSIPVFITLKDGVETDRKTGAQPKAVLLNMLAKNK